MERKTNATCTARRPLWLTGQCPRELRVVASLLVLLSWNKLIDMDTRMFGIRSIQRGDGSVTWQGEGRAWLLGVHATGAALSKIFLQQDSEMLRIIQVCLYNAPLAPNPFKDSKYFVDMELASTSGGPAAVYTAFREAYQTLLQKPVPEILSRCSTDADFAASLNLNKFVEEYFRPPDDRLNRAKFSRDADLVASKLSFVEVSKRLSAGDRIVGRRAVEVLNTLMRVVPSNLQTHYTTFIKVPKPFIIAGERFREAYYWDSYWAIRGLLLAGMPGAARSIIENMAWSIDRFGLMPNGFRKYYLDRSQPPYFFLMVDNYVTFTGDRAFLKFMYERVKREYCDFWMNPDRGHVIGVTLPSDYKDLSSANIRRVADIRKLSAVDNRHSRELKENEFEANIYYSPLTFERPESFVRDWELLQSVHPERKRPEVARALRAAAESGWDFSSRWIRPDETTGTFDLKNIETTLILPVDLNSLLWLMETKLATWAREFDKRSEYKFTKAAKRRRTMMEILMWDGTKTRWADYHTSDQQLSAVESAASFVPLWTGLSISAESDCAAADRLMSKTTGLVREFGIAATNQVGTGQQWDGPNSWPPLAQMALEYAIVKAPPQCEGVRRAAQEMVEVYLKCGALGLKQSADLSPDRTLWFYEKYNVNVCGQPGGGGEYVNQKGFAWTAAVMLEWIFYKARAFHFPNGVIEHPSRMPLLHSSAGSKASIRWNVVYVATLVTTAVSLL